MRNNYQDKNISNKILKIYPAIDLKEGKVVRLYKGKMDKSDIFNQDPISQAQLFLEEGFTYLHIVDLDNACEKGNNLKIIEQIISKTNLNIQIGGGIKSIDMIDNLLNIGANNIIIGSIAVTKSDLTKDILLKYPGKISLAIDVRDRFVAINGWNSDTKIKDIDLLNQYKDFDIFSIIYTDINRDGMMEGPNIKYMKEFTKNSKFNITASGGIATIKDVLNIYNLEDKFDSVIIGRALYEKKIDIDKLNNLNIYYV